MNVPSVSMTQTLPPYPPSSTGCWAVTARVKQIWVFPDPNSPMSSVMAPVSTPPPRILSSSWEPVVHLTMCRRISRTSRAGTKPGSTCILARRQTFTAVSLPIPARSAISLAGVIATACMVVYPAFRSFFTVVLATPFNIPGSSTSVNLSLLGR